MLLAAVLIAGTSSMFFTLAFNAYMPHLLAPDDRMEGNAKLQAGASAAEIAGPGLGGLLTEVAGAVGGLLIDAVTFIVSAACLLRLRTTPEPRAAAGERPGMFRQLSEGLGYFKYGEFMLPMLIVAAMINLRMLGVFSLRIVFLVRAEGIAPGTVGGLISLASLGGLLGAVLASSRPAQPGCGDQAGPSSGLACGVEADAVGEGLAHQGDGQLALGDEGQVDREAGGVGGDLRHASRTGFDPMPRGSSAPFTIGAEFRLMATPGPAGGRHVRV